MSRDTAVDFEQALSQLQEIVEHLEKGDLPLEQTLSEYEQGMRLALRCEDVLKQAEQRIKQFQTDDDQEPSHE